MKRLTLLFLLVCAPAVALAQVPAPDPAPAPVAAPTPVPPPSPQPEATTSPEATNGAPAPVAVVEDKPVVTKGDFMDVRLNLTLTNENVLGKVGDSTPSVPGWRFGTPNSLGVMFFDNYDTRFSGYETLSHLVLYKRHDSGRYEAEGALVLRLNDLAQDRIELSDAGSYLRVAYWFDETRRNPRRLSIVGFPTSSDRLRLGYSYRLSWGGSDEYRQSKNAVPGVKIQFDWDRGYAFIGGKSSILLDRDIAEERSHFAGLAGAGYDVTDMLRVEVNGGVFDRGKNTVPDVITENIVLYGASAQVGLHKGAPIGSSIDYQLYRNDAERIQELFKQPVYEGGVTWQVATEATVLGQTLKDPAVPGGTKNQFGYAGDVNGRLKVDRWRFRLDLQARDAAFILHSVPSISGADFEKSVKTRPNLFAAAGADYAFSRVPLTLGLIFGVDKPATITAPAGVIPGDMATTGETVSVLRRGLGDIAILPPGEKAMNQYATKGTAVVRITEDFATLVDAYYAYDPNQTRPRREDTESALMRQFGNFYQLGFNITLQARF